MQCRGFPHQTLILRIRGHVPPFEGPPATFRRQPFSPSVLQPIAPMHRINLADKLARFSTHWDPKIIAELNGQQVKLVKIVGEFVCHSHEHEDELFLVVRGGFQMQFRDRNVDLAEGDLIVVPRGVEHRPVAATECSILLFEPATTVNTGTAGGVRTVAQPDRL